MTKADVKVVQVLRQTAEKMSQGSTYMWGHMGSCNCGHLAQEVTQLSKGQIHAYAMQGAGDWNEQLNDYCESSQMPMDLVIFELLSFGFSMQDLKALEYVSNPAVLARLPKEKRHLRRNVREDVVVYLLAWADLLEEQILAQIELPNFALHESSVLA